MALPDGWKLVVEHPQTGQRLQVCEEHFDEWDHHPANHDHTDYTPATPVKHPETGEVLMVIPGRADQHAGRTGADRKSLKEEGWKPVAMIETATSEERELPKGYRWKADKA